jgi:hypothetical protein
MAICQKTVPNTMVAPLLDIDCNSAAVSSRGDFCFWPILPAERPAATLCGCHPGRRPTTELALAGGDALQNDDGLFDGVSLLAEVGERCFELPHSNW